MAGITLQINLSPGDIPYAEVLVPALVGAHPRSVEERLAIVDCCRPQRTQLVDPEMRFQEPEFSRRVERICAIAEDLRKSGYFDRIVYLRRGSPLFATLARKYLRGLIRETHDCWACALMAYLAAFETPTTRYVLHYDADILLHQEPGFDWSTVARDLMDEHPRALMATPRVSPPPRDAANGTDIPSQHNSGGILLGSEPAFWRVLWFSTRCFLLDRRKLEEFLPLLRGRFLGETLLRKWLKRSYPPSPETMLFRSAGEAGAWRMDLRTPRAWLLHPLDKSSRFLNLMPRLLEAVQKGYLPDEQRGWEDLRLPAWETYLGTASLKHGQSGYHA